MTGDAMLEAFYVDAGLSEEELREALAPEGDVERWLGDARFRLGLYDRKSVTLSWEAGDLSVVLPADYVQMGRLVPDDGTRIPAYDEWGSELAFREAAASSGSARLFYSALYPTQRGEQSSFTPAAEAACVAMVSYALSCFFRKMAASRANFQRYSTITGQSGIEARDLLDLADTHEAAFERDQRTLGLGAPSTFYGD